jgi:hypothetical protein
LRIRDRPIYSRRTSRVGEEQRQLQWLGEGHLDCLSARLRKCDPHVIYLSACPWCDPGKIWTCPHGDQCSRRESRGFRPYNFGDITIFNAVHRELSQRLAPWLYRHRCNNLVGGTVGLDVLKQQGTIDSVSSTDRELRQKMKLTQV